MPLAPPATPWLPRLAALPGLCEVCRQWGRGGLCADCVSRFAAPQPRCDRCARRWAGTPVAAGDVAVCGDCLRQASPIDRAACVADYGFPWDLLIADFKFNGRVELAGLIAARVALAVQSLPRPGLVLPVPLSPRRLAERGYNQAWEIARRVARRQRLPARADLLLRPLDTPHQATLTRAQRLTNLRAAFIVEPRQRSALQGRRVALVDDVMTTGATVREAARTLLAAGAAAVDVWVVARTPDE